PLRGCPRLPQRSARAERAHGLAQRNHQAGRQALMDLTFFPLTLDAIDQAAAESLCLFVASDERPLTGLAGLVDWRLTARLSRLVRGRQLTGEAGAGVP